LAGKKTHEPKPERAFEEVERQLGDSLKKERSLKEKGGQWGGKCETEMFGVGICLTGKIWKKKIQKGLKGTC